MPTFLWGVVNIGTQTEQDHGTGTWSAWARRDLVPRIGRANAYDLLYHSDHDLVEELGCNAMRITVEWSRIEPREGFFDLETIIQYREILQDLKDRHIKTVVGLWHWNIPMWCEEKYGMHDRCIVDKFMTYVNHVCDNLGDLIDVIVVLNEPMIYVHTGYIKGVRPPFLRSSYRAFHALRHMIIMHQRTYVMWKEKYPHTLIGTTSIWNDERGACDTKIQNLFLKIKTYIFVTFIIRGINAYSDYVGINYYTSNSFFFGKSGGVWGVHGTNDWHDPDVWHVFPEGLYRILTKASIFCKPIMIMENGKPTDSGHDDVDRQKFLKQTIGYMKKAMSDGIHVSGYFHYCLCDSYEWDSGYDFKFGLVEIDRTTQARKKRASFDTYKKIIAQNS